MRISKLFRIISGSTGRLMYQTSFTEFGEELGNPQRLTLEMIGMKLGRFN